MKPLDRMRTGFFYFDPADPIYRDHFPGSAVVPGSLVVHAFMKAIGRPKGVDAACTATRFRFKRFIAPGRYAFRIQARTDGRIECRLLHHDETVVTGVLCVDM